MPNTQATDAQLVNFSADDSGLAERVEELEAALKKIKDKDAKTKKKAAGKMSVTAGGRIMWDFATFDQNAASINQAGDMRNGTEFRRARIFLKGTGFDVIDYKIQFDFANTDRSAFKDVYITVKELPYLGHIRVGHFKEPWSLEEQTSSRFITFMERSLNNAFSPERNMGVMAFNHDACERMTWAAGAFTSITDEDPPIFAENTVYDDDGGYAATMRLTALPWYDEATEGRGLLHTGLSYTYRDIASVLDVADTRFQIRRRPEAHLGERIVSTGNIADASHVNGLNPELAFVYGPLSFQSEYTWYWVHRDSGVTEAFDGGYLYVSYFLTGEHRRYKRTAGAFDRVKPFENFFRVRAEDGCIYTGKGAWELGYRVSYLNLNSNAIQGGRAVDHTVGVNWYLNPYTRFMVNYVHSDTEGRDGATDTATVDLFECRAQIDF